MEKLKGVELIQQEREKQIKKHGFTSKFLAENQKYYYGQQLIYASELLSKPDNDDIFRPTAIEFELHPMNWDKEWFLRLMNKPYKERLVIAGALIASEIDRLNELEQ